MVRVAIIDYGVGNLRSLEKAFVAAGAAAIVSGDEKILRRARALVLPGVGAFGACMKELSDRGFDQLVVERVAEGIPVLGVCVGMQLLFEESEEFGRTKGLGLLRGEVRRFDDGLVVPHVGWNQVRIRREHRLFDGVDDRSFFYFVHSYFCEPKNDELILGTTDYGINYASIVGKENVIGVQFHLEKSQQAGLRLLQNFTKYGQ